MSQSGTFESSLPLAPYIPQVIIRPLISKRAGLGLVTSGILSHPTPMYREKWAVILLNIS